MPRKHTNIRISQSALQKVKQVNATMAIEDMSPSKEFMNKVLKVEAGQGSYSKLRQEIIQKYER